MSSKPKGTKTTPPVPPSSQDRKPSGLKPEEKADAIRLLTRKLATRDSGIASLILWIPTAMGDESLQAYAYTDGKKIYYCDQFFNLLEDQQLAVVIHETLHVALRHAHRFHKLRMAQGDEFSGQIANICADAIVIRAIKQQPKIGPLTITNPYIVIAEDIVTAEDLKLLPAPQWNFEMLYHYLQKKADEAIKKFMEKHGKDLNQDLKDGEGTPSDPHMEEMESRVWRERLKRAAAGTQPGSLLREVLKDLPDTKTPWEKHFREFMVAHVMPTTEEDWGRPSRRLLASKGRLGYYEPGIQREKGCRRAGLVIDTSGSIDDRLLQLFIGEANGILEQTGCELVIICADASVQSVERFKEKITSEYHCKGGGGTDFRPALTELEKYDIDCCVYLTDMAGTFPSDLPPFPVMWATIVDQEPPFGRKVLVEYSPFEK